MFQTVIWFWADTFPKLTSDRETISLMSSQSLVPKNFPAVSLYNLSAKKSSLPFANLTENGKGETVWQRNDLNNELNK